MRTWSLKLSTTKQILQKAYGGSHIQKGHLMVYAGETSMRKRFVVPISCFNQPSFKKLPDVAKEEFGFDLPTVELENAGMPEDHHESRACLALWLTCRFIPKCRSSCSREHPVDEEDQGYEAKVVDVCLRTVSTSFCLRCLSGSPPLVITPSVP
ncbi:Auxin-responsive protein SAUR24-like protein [Drosera capensis]